MSNSIPLGQLIFNQIEIDPENIAKACRDFLIHGSKKHVIGLDDLVIVSDQANLVRAFSTLADALHAGTKFFDAVAYFSLPPGSRPEVRVASNDELPDKRGLNEVGEALFFQLFHVMVRGSPNSSNIDDTQIPGFLRNVRGLKEAPAVYAKRISSFSLDKIDWRFIRQLPWERMAQEAINRLGLGVAGYRMLGPFKHYPADKTLTPSVANAVEIAKKMATSPADWTIHSVTRSADFIQRFGNLNANLKNLITLAYSESTIDMMLQNKLLYEKPTFDARHQQFMSWPTDVTLNDPIFPIRH